MDRKWSERFSRHEMLLLSLERSEPTFQTVKMPANVTQPFIVPKPADQPRSTWLTSGCRTSPTDWPAFYWPDQSVSHQIPGMSGLQTTQDSHCDNEMDTDSDGDPVHQPASGVEEEGELSDLEHNLIATESGQALSEEQSHRETVHGIKSFMGWTHIPDMDNCSSSADDNLFAALKQQPVEKISVKLPTDEWFVKRWTSQYNLGWRTPSRASETGGLQEDQFVKVRKSQSKWYGPHPSKEKSAGSGSSWGSESVKLNSSYSRIARYSSLSTPAPASHPISQVTLRRWEKSACKSTYVTRWPVSADASVRYSKACKPSSEWSRMKSWKESSQKRPALRRMSFSTFWTLTQVYLSGWQRQWSIFQSLSSLMWLTCLWLGEMLSWHRDQGWGGHSSAWEQRSLISLFIQP